VLVAACLGLLLITIGATAVVRARSTSASPVPQSEPGPVLLVPGYGGNVNSLEPLAAALRSGGRTAMVVTPPGDGTGDLRAQATHLGDVAGRAVQDTGATSVDIIG
jgi:triacylglycerol lipase